jgi:ferredoxin
LDEDGKLKYLAEVSDDRLEAVEAAADVCPMQAITIHQQ